MTAGAMMGRAGMMGGMRGDATRSHMMNFVFAIADVDGAGTLPSRKQRGYDTSPRSPQGSTIFARRETNATTVPISVLPVTT